jgi:hypothetical protein
MFVTEDDVGFTQRLWSRKTEIKAFAKNPSPIGRGVFHFNSVIAIQAP